MPTSRARPLWKAVALAAIAFVFCGAEGILGGLYVTTEPAGCAVYVDGRLSGVSPCGIADVAVGTVEVRAVRQGHRQATRNVEIKAGQTTEVALSLPAVGTVGSIAVLVEPPGARIELDRVPAGRTPKVLLNVRPGTHRLVVSAEGHRALHSTVTVTPEALQTVRAALEPLGGSQHADRAGVDPAELRALDWRRAPRPEELPEDRALQPARRLVAERRYEEALARLNDLGAGDTSPAMLRRMGRERNVIRRLQDLVEVAHTELRAAEGEQYVLNLRKGIRLTGRLVKVGDHQLSIELADETRSLPLSSLAAGQIVRLASRKLDASRPANMTTFALLHASEGEFEDAYEFLRGAAAGGHDITVALSYVEAEATWAAARRKQEALARTGASPLVPRFVAEGQKIQLAVDLYRGADPELPESILAPSLFAVRRLSRTDGADFPGAFDVLLIRDPGTTRAVAAYQRQDVQGIMDFVHGGGGLVFFGAPRPPDQPHPFAPLLRWCGVLVHGDRLALTDDAPEQYPSRYALCAPPPGPRHPVTEQVGRVVFPLSSASLQVRRSVWTLLRASRFVRSGDGDDRAPVMGAAGTYGAGRFVVLADVPLMNRSAYEGSPFYGNDGARMLQAALLWAARGNERRRRNAQ